MAEQNTNKPDTFGFNSVTYEFDYFSSAQIGIYCGDVLIDDINHIEFSVSQTKRPIYGYASQYYHVQAPGQVLVEGAFSVNFKEADYIIATLARYQHQMAPIRFEKESKRYLVKRENIERLLERTKSSDPPLKDQYELYQDLVALPDQAFEDVAEEFEDMLWQQPGSEFDTPNISQPWDSKNWQDDHYRYRRGDQYLPFDIYILYGDITCAAANHTIKKIVGAEIVGQGQAIDDNGAPVQEIYRFTARNLA